MIAERDNQSAIRPVVFDLLTLAALFFISFSPFLLGKYTAVPITTVGVVPGGAVGSSQLVRYMGADFGGTLGELSVAEFAKRTIAAGEWPFWNPYQSIGAPQMAEPAMLALFYPLNALRLLLPASHWDVVTLLGVFLAGLFIWGLAREWGQGRAAALFSGACVYTLGATQLYLAVPSVASTMVWTPALWWIVARVMRRNAVGWMWLPAILVTYCIVTAGNVTPAFMGAVTMALYVIIRCCIEPRLWRTMLGLLPAFLCGVALAAPHLLLFLDYAADAGAILGRHRNAYTYGLVALPTMVIPYLYGEVHTPLRFAVPGLPIGYFLALGWLTPLASLTVLAGTAWAIAQRRAAQLAFLAVPALLLLLATDPYPLSLLTQVYPFSRINNQYTPWMAGIALCVFAGHGLDYLCQAPAIRVRRWLRVFALALGLCALLSVLPLLSRGSEAMTRATWLILVGGIGVAAGWLYVAALIFSGVRERGVVWQVPLAFTALMVAGVCYFPSGLRAETVLSFHVVSIMIFGAVIWRVRRPYLRWQTSPLVTAGLIAGTVVVAVNVQAPNGFPIRRDPYRTAPFVDFLRERTADYRVFGLDAFLFPNTSGALGVSGINMLSPMMADWSFDVLKRVMGMRNSPSNLWGISVAQTEPWDLLARNGAGFDYLAVKYAVTSRSRASELALLVDPSRSSQAEAAANIVFRDPETDAVIVERPQAQPRGYFAGAYAQAADWRAASDRFLAQADLRAAVFGETGSLVCANGEAKGQVRVATMTANTITLEAETSGPGTLVLVDGYMPGWTALVNGRPVAVQRVNGAFRGLCLGEAGTHRVVMQYTPPLWRTSTRIAMVAGGLLVLMTAFCFIWRRRSTSSRA